MVRWVRIAFKVAKKGRHKVHHVGAVVIKGGRVVSKAANMSRPYQKINCGFHAEERALRGNKDFRGAVIIVVRSNVKSNISGLSRPCDKCMKVIRAKGIKKIGYINQDKEFVLERVW